MRSLIPGLLMLTCVTLVGCPKPSPDGPRVRGRRVAAVPDAETAVSVEGFLRPEKRTLRLSTLPPFPRFRDPYPLPSRSLRKERRMAYRTSGQKRQVLISHIAARLWRLANQKIDQVRSLLAAAKSEGRPPPRDRIDRLQRKVSAHLRECVTLLEGVLESKQPPPMARVRLAHYLRKLKPAASAKLFERLLADTANSRRRVAYGLDLAQLRVGLGQPHKALKVLRSLSKHSKTARAALLEALARLPGNTGSGRFQRLVQRLIRLVGALPRPQRRSVVHHLPALLARTVRPARLLRSWSSTDAAGFKAHGASLATRLIEALVDRGALPSARRVLRVAVGAGLGVPASLRSRVHRFAGPWKTRATPPPAVSWTAQIRARLPAVTRCYASVVAPLQSWRLELLIPPDGAVRKVRGGPVAVPKHPTSKTSAPTPASLARCITRTARGWKFQPWKAARAIRLTLTLRPAP